jgi:hypothetical protein
MGVDILYVLHPEKTATVMHNKNSIIDFIIFIIQAIS